MMPAIFIGLAVLLGAGLYFAYIWFSAWFEVKALPREEVFMCNYHGPIHKGNLIEFMGIPYCPSCFHSKLSAAERIPK